MRFSGVFSLIFLFAFAVSAQTAPKFVSPYGNFEIALPPTPNLTRGVRNADWPDKGAGMIYAWEIDNIVFTALYLDPLDETANDPAALLEDNNRNVRETAKRYGGAVQIENEVRVGEFPGRQLVAQIGAGKMITRNIQAGRRSYSLQAITRDPKDSPRAFEIIGTFRIVDGRAGLLTQFGAIEPKPLPRTKIPRNVKSDLEIANINGRVSKIVEETEDLTGDAPQQGRILSAELFYDKRGLITREHLCDGRGLPLRASVYGFVKGKAAARVSIRRGQSNDTTEFRIVSGYDNAGRLSETRFLRINGNVQSRITYVYVVDTIVTTTYDDNNSEISKTKTKLDASGNVIEISDGDNIAVFHYDTSEKNGNWTKRTTFERRIVDGKPVDVPQTVTYRMYSMY